MVSLNIQKCIQHDSFFKWILPQQPFYLEKGRWASGKKFGLRFFSLCAQNSVSAVAVAENCSFNFCGTTPSKEIWTINSEKQTFQCFPANIYRYHFKTFKTFTWMELNRYKDAFVPKLMCWAPKRLSFLLQSKRRLCLYHYSLLFAFQNNFLVVKLEYVDPKNRFIGSYFFQFSRNWATLVL